MMQDRDADGAAHEDAALLGTDGKKARKEKKVHEAGGVIVYGDKVVLRLTDKQRWIFPKGKLKKHESAEAAAMREATEETGLKVEVLSEVADLLIFHEGKKRRFVYFLMRATGKTWDWPHHEGRDTFLIDPDKVLDLLRHEGYERVWAACAERVRSLCGEVEAGCAARSEGDDESPPLHAAPAPSARASSARGPSAAG
ncbi:MAG: NUDIX domain-containing protein [Chloroflexi bacterium]|nr:NUDIX domain-containing protein [Chloroflexota bacterium]